MGCCCSSEGSEVDSLDEPLVRDTMTDSDAGSIAGSRYADEHVGPTGTAI